MRLKPFRARRPLAALSAAFVAATLVQGTNAFADTATPPEALTAPSADKPSEVVPQDRDKVLGKDWKTSTDRAWTTSGDADGFHVLTADAKAGYGWRTAATLKEPGFDADQWIGNACVTGSGKRLVAVYAPRTFTNDATLFARGGFAAVVDLESGVVTKLAVNASLAYYSPGCGAGEQAVLTQSGGDDKPGTRLVTVDATSGKTAAPLAVEGQVTSAVPAADGSFVAADTDRVVRITTDGKRAELTRTDGTPFHLKPDAEGGVVFMDHANTAASVKRLPGRPGHAPTARPKADVLATGASDQLGLTAGAGGRVFITGDPKQTGHLPGPVKQVKAPVEATVSTEGRSVVNQTRWADQSSPQLASPTGTDPRPVAIELSVPGTGQSADFTVKPAEQPLGTAAVGSAPSPALRSTAKGATQAPSSPAKSNAPSAVAPRSLAAAPAAPAAAPTGSSSDPVEAERVCAVPRNDPRNQAMQPKPRQVEWAVDQAIVGNLNTPRPANWKNLGMPAYTPQGLFPPTALEGGGHIPAQIMLGIIAQESNMWQAARYAVPGVTGNPLVGNFYGRELYNASSADDWDIDFAKADCGYGLTQQTDGMRLPAFSPKDTPAFAYQTQRAVALDYATNIAAGLNTLAEKWNTTRRAGMTVNNGDVSKPENWYYAAWAYNSGFHPKTSDGSPWGLGWSNNPANPNYPANRKPFLNNNSYADAAHPQDWPYPEKIMGWAAYPIEGLESPGKTVPGFRAAWWNGKDANLAAANRFTNSPPLNQFCDDSNSCKPGQSFTPNAPDVAGAKAGPCAHQNAGGQYDLHCWYNKPVTWKSDCSYSCGNEVIRFNTTYPEEADGTAYPPNCTTNPGLPIGAMVIDDLPDDVPSIRPNCPRTANSGTFSLDFAQDSSGHFPSKVDLHQLGAGFGGHFYFAHTRTAGAEGGKLAVTGTWKLNQDVNGPAQVLVHLPDHGAQTTQAAYQVETAKGTRTRVIPQPGTGNRWVPIGTFLFNGKPTVRLSNVTDNGTGDQDIAYDAIAVAPVKGQFVERTFDAVSVFDPNQSLDSNMPSQINTPMRGMDTLYDWAKGLADQGPGWNDHSTSTRGILADPVCAAGQTGACVKPAVGAAAKQWYDDIVNGGRAVRSDGSAPAMSEPVWMGMANRRPDPAATVDNAFASQDSYKIKSRVTVSYLLGDDGKIISGSEFADGGTQVGNAHLPKFVTGLIHAVAQDYGIPEPDLSYDEIDAYRYSGGNKLHVNPLVDGDTPGQAYLPHTRGARLSADGQCVDVRHTGGGVHGYRAMTAQQSVNDNFKAWVDKVNGNGAVQPAVAHAVSEIYQMFFKNQGPLGYNTFGNTIGNAPPIWHNIAMAFCADGSVKATQNFPNRDSQPNYGLVYQSYMPDLYLYLDGRLVDNEGKPTATPVHKGDWKNFSNIPLLNSDAGNAFGQCDVDARGSGGNPWNIGIPFPVIGNAPGDIPTRMKHCDDTGTTFNSTFTP
ncbi:hypothetical protein CFP65_3814 [Kitasatospora sp. MMS16-BH015]|uniref:golvesin C-terminal-like domain-containing protein n=1 Tax=Kitasatospora sp. MMS16-BH015 TaxID=2018025 RepID=UPI000CA0C5F1|nr:hypothetical protein [Kitasatospora sp. MMS16-BH015]AUG78594.1 hypothetical protein CFP65_3814 [Kitasatospora sp. MMS16-BH015]